MSNEEMIRIAILVVLQETPGLTAEELAPRVLELVAQGEEEIRRRGRAGWARRHPN
jgi:hypothetical protein